MADEKSLLNSLEKERISKLIFRFSLPSLAIVAVSGSYNIIDGIFLGKKLGILGNTVNAYIFLVYMIFFAVSALVSQGASAILTISLGEKDYKKAEQIIGITVFLSLFVSILQSVLIYLGMDNLILLFGIDQNQSEYFKSYFMVFLLCSPIYFLSHSLLYCLRAQGKINCVLILSLLSFIVNLVLGYVLIIIYEFGFPGSAMATIGANLASCIICIYLFMRKGDHLRIKFREIRWRRSIGLEIIKSGTPYLLLNLASVFLILIYNDVAKKYAGNIGLATLSIGSSIYRYITLVTNAITNGMQPIVGYNYGAKNYKRVKQTVTLTIMIASLICLILAVLIEVNVVNIIKLYGHNNSEFIKFAADGVKLVLIALPLQGLNAISISYFQNINKNKISLTLVVLRQFIFQLPLALTLPCFFEIDGLWHSFWISDILITLIAGLLLIKSFYHGKHFSERIDGEIF